MNHIASMVMELLKSGEPHRELYRARDGGWFITHGGGAVSDNVARDIIASGEVNSVYSNCPTDAYHVGKTLDVDATIAERKKHRHGKDAPKIYIQDRPAPTQKQPEG